MLWNTSSIDAGVVKGAEDAGVQDVTRPSELVWDVNVWGDEVEVEALGVCSVSVTGMSLPGFPIVVSSTWHVIGGFFSVAIFFATTSGFGDEERCDEMAAMRDEAGLGMRVCRVQIRFSSSLSYISYMASEVCDFCARDRGVCVVLEMWGASRSFGMSLNMTSLCASA